MLLCDWDYILPAVEKEALGYRLGDQPVSMDVSLGVAHSRTKRKGENRCQVQNGFHPVDESDSINKKGSRYLWLRKPVSVAESFAQIVVIT